MIPYEDLKQLNRPFEQDYLQQLATLYHEYQYILPPDEANYYHVYHIFNIRHPKRHELQQYLTGKGIGTVIHYPFPPHRQKALTNLFEGQPYAITDEIHNTTLSLSCSFCHTEEQVMQVMEALNQFEA